MRSCGGCRTIPSDPDRLAAAVEAAKFLIATAGGTDVALAAAAVTSLARPAWPSSLDIEIAGALQRAVRASTDAATRKLSAQGLAALRGDPQVQTLIAQLLAEVTDPAVCAALKLDANHSAF